MQYLGTWSHTRVAGRKSPRDLDKTAFGELLLRLLGVLFRAVFGARRARLNQVGKAGVFAERHVNGELHYHFPILAEFCWCFVPLARALRTDGIYVDFSTEHDYYWTSFLYLTTPSSVPGGKRMEDLDADPWLSPGHPAVHAMLTDIPRGARACDKARVRRFLGAVEPGGSRKDVSLTDKEFADHIVARGLHDRTQVLAWIEWSKQQGQALAVEERMVSIGVEAFVYKNQNDLDRRLAFAWEVKSAQRVLAERAKTAMQFVIEGQSRPCVCGGRWIPCTEQLLSYQVAAHRVPGDAEVPHSWAVRDALRRALVNGCAKRTNVFIYGPKDAGKSHVLKPMKGVFGGYCFVRPAGRGNFPLQDMFGAKVIVLQDLRTTTYKLGWDDLLAWWEGECLRVPMPQNAHVGDKEYMEKAPLFASSGGKLRISPKEAAELRVPEATQNDMMDERWVYFHHSATLQNVDDTIPSCPACWCRWCCIYGQIDMPGPALALTLMPAPAPALSGAIIVNPPQVVSPMAPAAQPSAEEEAKDALLDWLETHGGAIVCAGAHCNLAVVADGVAWSHRFHAACGRMLPFLRRCGVCHADNSEVIVAFN